MTGFLDALLALLPHFSLGLSLVWGGYLLVLAAWIVLEKREPIATLSWLLVLAWLPVVGFLIYHLFGPRRIRRQRRKRLRARSGLPADWQVASAGRSDKAGLTRLIASSSGHDASSASTVELLVDGRETFAALLAAIASARQHIHLEYYIFEPDQTGTLLRDALIARAQAGVRVRLLLDAVGHPDWAPLFWRRCAPPASSWRGFIRYTSSACCDAASICATTANWRSSMAGSVLLAA